MISSLLATLTLETGTWQVIVGGLQAVILFFTIWAIILQTAAMKNNERAWVLTRIEWDTSKWADGKGHVLEGSGTGGDTTAIYAVLICGNEGKSPAWIEEKRAKFEIVSVLPAKPNFESADFIQVETEPIGIGNSLPHTNHISWQPLAAGHKETGKMMVVYGVVKYRDIFQRLHETTFGYRITTNRELVRLEGKNHRQYNKNT